MNYVKSDWRLIISIVSGFVLVGCATPPEPTIQTGPDAELSFDGLHKVDNSRADVAWARPDFDISGYTKIWPVSGGIEYRQVRDRGRGSMARSQSGPYFIDDKARAQFEQVVGDVFKEELAKIKHYEIVDGPGPDVLMVRGGLLDVTSYVPPEPVGGRSFIFLSRVGEATLVLELRDSETTTILARSLDRRAAETINDTFRQSNSVTNSTEVRRLIRYWGSRLVEALDGFSPDTTDN